MRKAKTALGMDREFSNRSVSGLVTSSEWDSDGNPVELKLCGRGEEDYFLIDEANNLDLARFNRKWVEVFGELLVLENVSYLKIRTIKLLNNGDR